MRSRRGATWRGRRIVWGIAFGLVALATSTTAAAKLSETGNHGLAQESQYPDGTGIQVATIRVGSDTALVLIDPATGAVRLSRIVEGRFELPEVAADGTTDGVSADGDTIVLIEDRSPFAAPPASTRLRVFEIVAEDRRIALRRHDSVELPGDYEVSALAADGDSAVLIQNRLASNGGPRVRRFTLKFGHLLPALSTPQLPDESSVRNGFPTTRATSADGQWAYTLLEGREAAILALDTGSGKATAVPLGVDVTRKLGHDPTGYAELTPSADGAEVKLGDSAGQELATLDTARLSLEEQRRATKVTPVWADVILTTARQSAAITCAAIPALRLWNSLDGESVGFADGDVPNPDNFEHYAALAFAADLPMEPIRLQRAAYIGCSAGLGRQ